MFWHFASTGWRVVSSAVHLLCSRDACDLIRRPFNIFLNQIHIFFSNTLTHVLLQFCSLRVCLSSFAFIIISYFWLLCDLRRRIYDLFHLSYISLLPPDFTLPQTDDHQHCFGLKKCFIQAFVTLWALLDPNAEHKRTHHRICLVSIHISIFFIQLFVIFFSSSPFLYDTGSDLSEHFVRHHYRYLYFILFRFC